MKLNAGNFSFEYEEYDRNILLSLCVKREAEIHASTIDNMNPELFILLFEEKRNFKFSDEKWDSDREAGIPFFVWW